jgi:hypothetical protein
MNPASDQFSRWPLYSGLAVLATGSITMLLPIFAVLLFILPVYAVGLLVAAIWCGSVALFRGQWRRALSTLAIPLMVLLTVPSMEMVGSARDDLRFLIHKNRYEAAVAKAKSEGKHSATVDDWSLFVTDNTFIVWDEQDRPEELIHGFKSYRSFGNHFYKIGD